jgi:wyosine [tRNA(Phe)-imidazoG37] synthetase (radical SAM superfamily)
MRLARTRFFPVAEIVSAVEHRLEACRREDEPVHFVTFVPDGEPTLDAGLGEEIRSVRALGVPVAVITNGSLLWSSEIRDELSAADLVSVKVDAADGETWRAIDRPHGGLEFHSVFEGIRSFAREYRGELLTETMLVAGLNDEPEQLEALARLVGSLAPSRACLATPIRPPAETGVCPPDEATLVHAWVAFRLQVEQVELLVREPEGEFWGIGDPEEELLSILAVHPMPEPAVRRFFSERELGSGALPDLLRSGRVLRIVHEGHAYICRPLRRKA